MIALPDHLAHRIRTAATLLANLSNDVPNAPPTIFGIVASIATGAPEVQFPAYDALLVAFVAGELDGIAAALDEPLPLLLVAAGVEKEIAADEEAMANALSMARLATRSGDHANEM